jgi:hypothetical protein
MEAVGKPRPDGSMEADTAGGSAGMAMLARGGTKLGLHEDWVDISDSRTTD